MFFFIKFQKNTVDSLQQNKTIETFYTFKNSFSYKKKKNFNHNKPCDQEKKTKHLNLFFSKAGFAVFALKKYRKKLSYFLKKNKLLLYIYRLLLFVFLQAVQFIEACR